jgi:sec-independent protein translocase protein TatC
MEHVAELRVRLLWWGGAVAIGSGLGYVWRQPIQDALLKPLNLPLFYTSPGGGFNFLLKICLFFGVLVSVPVLVYHLLRFIEPTLPHRSRFLIVKALIASTALTVAGAAFAYYVTLPAALHFLNEFSSDQVKALISTNEYISFVTIYVAAFAMLFQLPLILLFVNNITPLSPGGLMKQQRLVVVLSFVAAAIITPTPDIVNQTLMALPIIVLYQISIVLVWVANRKAPKPPVPEPKPETVAAAPKARRPARSQVIDLSEYRRG